MTVTLGIYGYRNYSPESAPMIREANPHFWRIADPPLHEVTRTELQGKPRSV